MAWECMLFADTGDIDIADLTEERLLPMGTKDEIHRILHRVFQNRQWDRNSLVRLSDGGYIEFYFGDIKTEGDVVTNIATRSNASNESILEIGHLCEQLHWIYFGWSGSPLMRTNQEISSYALDYTDYKNKVVTGRINKILRDY